MSYIIMQKVSVFFIAVIIMETSLVTQGLPKRSKTPVGESSISGLPAEKPPQKKQKRSPKIDVPALSTDKNIRGNQAELPVNNKTSGKTSSEHEMLKQLSNEQKAKSNSKANILNEISHIGPQLFQRYSMEMAAGKNLSGNQTKLSATPVGKSSISRLFAGKPCKKRQDLSQLIYIPALSKAEKKRGNRANLSANIKTLIFKY
ncbi:uncharacterized protein LOC126846827 [Adelges cooleyi]|uniref:uncharacterized protein LOC126846827 n=1 Tax=Adelges cooleyi TaxID=133065 RepID=UPI002180856E|nr:uncharacterized protein LOC126846827 [Adelges cooleyi]